MYGGCLLCPLYPLLLITHLPLLVQWWKNVVPVVIFACIPDFEAEETLLLFNINQRRESVQWTVFSCLQFCRTPLQKAERHNFHSIVTLLLERNARRSYQRPVWAWAITSLLCLWHYAINICCTFTVLWLSFFFFFFLLVCLLDGCCDNQKKQKSKQNEIAFCNFIPSPKCDLRHAWIIQYF